MKLYIDVDANGIYNPAIDQAIPGVQVVIACEPLEDSPAMLALTRVATGALLVVRLGQSRFSAVRKTVEAVGRDRVITSVTLKPRK